jgi:hypothetical protein
MMVQLRVTNPLPWPAINEEEAITRIFQQIELLEEKMVTEASRKFFVDTLANRFRGNLTDRMKVIEDADKGDPIADAALIHLFDDMMDRREEPPACLISYIARAHRRGPLKRGKGRDVWDNLGRNVGLSCLIFSIMYEYGVLATRSAKTSR